MTACEGCHRSKVKCDLQEREYNNGDSTPNNGSLTACSRCQRLSLVCVRRISRQGQRPAKKRRPKIIDAINGSHFSNNKNEEMEDDGLDKSGSGDCKLGSMIVRQLNANVLKSHYGVQYMIHHWTSTAFSRRSLSLLSRATKLAFKANVSMDAVFAEDRRDILNPLIWSVRNGIATNSNDKKHYASSGERVATSFQWSDIPQRLRHLSQIPVDPIDSMQFQQHRYIWARQAYNGHTSFLVSDAFAKELATLDFLHETWEKNQQSIIQVLTESQSDIDKFTCAVQYSLARYVSKDTHPTRVRVNGMRLKVRKWRSGDTNGSTTSIGAMSSHAQIDDSVVVGVRDMDMLTCFEIMGLDHSFHVAEFVPTSTTINGKVAGRGYATTTRTRQTSSSKKNEMVSVSDSSKTEQNNPNGTEWSQLASDTTSLPAWNDDDQFSLPSFRDDDTLLDTLHMDEDLQDILDLFSD